MRPLAISLLIGAAALAGCGSGGSSSSSDWSGLAHVRVVMTRPLPPPYGGPFTKVYADPPELTRVTVLLNRHHIVALSSTSSNPGCAGGYQVQMTIREKGGATHNLSAYRCAGHTAGNVGGDLVGFLTDLGFQIS